MRAEGMKPRGVALTICRLPESTATMGVPRRAFPVGRMI